VAVAERELLPELGAFEHFCSLLQLSQGKPFGLEPFQRLIVGDYFNGIRETLVLIPKKNGKTTLLAALALYHVMSTPDADCVIGAASRDQASIMFDQADGFLRRNEGLQQRLVARRGYREIRSKRDAGRIRVLAADVDTADGVIPTLALVDELGRHKKPDLYGVFRDGLGPRDGQLVGISTAGEHEGTPLGVIRAAAHKLPSTREGRYLYAHADDASFALHEWALDDDDDVHDMQLVKQVNPASWQSIDLLSQRHNSPSMMSWQWARLACGIWLSADMRWMDAAAWYEHELEQPFAPGERITLGFDGSRYSDSTALVACRISDGAIELLDVWEHPGGGAEWEVPGGAVEAAIARAMDDYKVVRGYFDPPLWQSEIEAWARMWGEDPVTKYWTNRARFMAAIERFRTDHASGKIDHVVDERLTAHMLAAQLREARGGYILAKGRAWNDRIDAAISSVLAYEARNDAIAGGMDENKGYAFL
jgi:phage terminase large subunit-like protein